MTVDVINFGCRLNIAEGEAIRSNWAGGDAIIVNSCAVTAEAERQARQAIRRRNRRQSTGPLGHHAHGRKAVTSLPISLRRVGLFSHLALPSKSTIKTTERTNPAGLVRPAIYAG